MDRSKLLARARERGANPFVYWPVRALLHPLFWAYFRLRLLGREHVPQDGPLIIASNHRSFLDPFVVGLLVRRPVYFVAKRELFERRFLGWLLNSLGAFPIDRGNADADAMTTAREILERGDVVVIFPEGTRVRPGPLGRPKRGVGRLAFETGAPVVPVAVAGSEDVRRGWRIRPRRVTVRAGRPLTFPRAERPSPRLAGAVTDRIWPCVALQWEWLGGVAPVRRAAVIGTGESANGIAGVLERAGIDVAAGTQHLDLEGRDLVVLATPPGALRAALDPHAAAIPRDAGVLVLADDRATGAREAPSDYVAERTRARAVGVLATPAPARDLAAGAAPVIIASADRGFSRQVADALGAAGIDARVAAPPHDGLARIIEGRRPPERWLDEPSSTRDAA